MAKPLNKNQLLEAAQKQYAQLETYISSLSFEQKTAAQDPQKSIKDILAHLYEWQQMFFSWYESGLRGETPPVPAPGYKWNQLPALNQAIFEKYSNLPLAEALVLFRASHAQTMQFIERLTDTDLCTPGLYPWMNRNTLLAYLNSITASHYVWALKEIKKSLVES